MTLLVVMPEDDRDAVLVRTTVPEEIAGELAPFGIRLERWATVPLPPGAGSAEVLATYRAEVDRVSAEGPYPIVDVIRIAPDADDPQWMEKATAARRKFLDEHKHDEDEVRFFVEGTGCFYLHLDAKVYAVVCEEGDLMSVPAGTTHWFDMGERPTLCAIRFFQEEDGWVANFTGASISTRMPTLDELLAPTAP